MKINKDWFTLIEMIIAITIFFIFVVWTYVNYAYYQNIAQVKLTLKDISQNLAIARNMSINWIQSGGINQSVWVYFEKNGKNMKYFLYNYTGAILSISWNSYKEVEFKPNITITNIKAWIQNLDNVLILFDSITWKTSFYNYFTDSFIENDSNILEIDISFKNATNFPLKRTLKYFKNTSITDY